VKVGNFGTRSVLDVELTRLEIPGQPDLIPERLIPERRTLPVVAPARDSPRHDNNGNPQFVGGLFTYSSHTNGLITTRSGDVTATVEFTDIRGNTWEAVFMASVDRYRPFDALIGSTERQSIRRIK
jgi:hypothetical protein